MIEVIVYLFFLGLVWWMGFISGRDSMETDLLLKERDLLQRQITQETDLLKQRIARLREERDG